MLSLDRIKVSGKLQLLTGLTAIALIAVCALAAWLLHQKIYQERQARLRSAVEIAAGLATAAEERIKDGMPREQSMTEFRKALTDMRYDGGDGYFFVYDEHGVVIADGSRPNAVGEDRSRSRDVDGKLIVAPMLDIVRQGDNGYVEYMYRDSLPGTASSRPGPIPTTSRPSTITPWPSSAPSLWPSCWPRSLSATPSPATSPGRSAA